MKRVALLTAALMFAGVASAECESLARKQYSAMWGIDTPISQIVSDVLHETGWKLDYEVIGTEPKISGSLGGPASIVIDKIVNTLVASGIRVNYRYYPDQCRLWLAVKNANAREDVAAASAARNGGEGSASVAAAVSPAAGTHDSKEWVLPEGVELHKALTNWADQAGWKLVWRSNRTWMVPAGMKFGGSFVDALSSVIEALYEQGKPVKLVIWEGNKLAEVIDVEYTK